MLDTVTATPPHRTRHPALPAVRSLADRDEYGPITGRPGGLFTAAPPRPCSASATTSAAGSPTGCPRTTCSRPYPANGRGSPGPRPPCDPRRRAAGHARPSRYLRS